MQLLQSLSQPPTADLGIAEIVPMLQKCTDILESRQKQKFLGPSDLEHLHKSVKEEKDMSVLHWPIPFQWLLIKDQYLDFN